MKKLFALTLSLAMLLSLFACGTEPAVETLEEFDLTEENTATTEEAKTEAQETEETPLTDDTTIRIMAMTGPTGMGLSSMIHNDKEEKRRSVQILHVKSNGQNNDRERTDRV